MEMDKLDVLNEWMKTMIEKKQFIEELAVSFFCIFTPVGKYRKYQLLKLINREIEELKEEIEIEKLFLMSILVRDYEEYPQLKKYYLSEIEK